MSGTRWKPIGRVARALGLVAAALAILGFARPDPLLAHEGHAPLPTKGATVQGNQVLLSERARRAIGVESAKVTLGDVERVVHARARVQLPWHQQAMITTLVPGRVERVLVRPGDEVEAGQELARVESPELETLQRDLLRAIAERSLAERMLAQREDLGRSNAVAPTVILEARRDADEARARVEVANRKLLALGISANELERVQSSGVPLRDLPIVSPIRGVVVHADVRVGQVVATDEHLFHVVDLAEVEVVGEVLESDAPLIRVGQAAEATLAALPGKVSRGRIDHTHLTVEPQTRALSVIAHVENPDHALKPGMTGLMSIRVGLAEQAIVCPAGAVVTGPATPFVLLDRGEGRYERRAVRLGMRSGDRIEILDGLFPGDRVVVTGTGLLASLLPSAPAARREDRVQSASRSSSRKGEVVAQGEVELPVERKRFASSQVEGRIARILVHPGDEVRAGQVLAEVESLPLRTLQLDLLQARTRRKWAADSVKRLKALAVHQAAARIDLWREEAALEVLTQTIGEIRSRLLTLGLGPEALARLEQADLSSDDCGERLAAGIPIRAPVGGRLEHFDVVPGQVVVPAAPGRVGRPEGPLFEIHDRSRVWVCAHVRERDALSVHVGQPARITFPALAGVEVTGSVMRVSPVLESDARVLPVWIEVENPDGRLYEGMLARAVIDVASGREPVARLGPEVP